MAVVLNLLPFSIESREERERHIPPPKDIKLYTFGYNGPIADSLWLNWIQNFDECGKPKIERGAFEQFNKNFKTPENLIDQKLGFDRSKRKVCNKGWAYEMLRAVADLSPRFRLVYAVGAPSLSVVGEDHEGARLLFDRGLKEFPDDWRITYRAAYHYLFELDDMQKAANLLSLAGRQGAPNWVRSLASRLYSRLGQLEIGLATLIEYEASVVDPQIREQVKGRIAELKSQIEAVKKLNK